MPIPNIDSVSGDSDRVSKALGPPLALVIGTCIWALIVWAAWTHWN